MIDGARRVVTSSILPFTFYLLPFVVSSGRRHGRYRADRTDSDLCWLSFALLYTRFLVLRYTCTKLFIFIRYIVHGKNILFYLFVYISMVEKAEYNIFNIYVKTWHVYMYMYIICENNNRDDVIFVKKKNVNI